MNPTDGVAIELFGKMRELRFTIGSNKRLLKRTGVSLVRIASQGQEEAGAKIAESVADLCYEALVGSLCSDAVGYEEAEKMLAAEGIDVERIERLPLTRLVPVMEAISNSIELAFPQEKKPGARQVDQ